MFCGTAEGLTCRQFAWDFHIHPRHEGVSMRPPGKMGDMDAIQAHAEKIRAALAQ